MTTRMMIARIATIVYSIGRSSFSGDSASIPEHVSPQNRPEAAAVTQ